MTRWCRPRWPMRMMSCSGRALSGRGKFGARAETPDAAERARQMRFLMSRGFSGETIRRVLRGDFEDD